MDHCLSFYGRLRWSALFIYNTISVATAQFTSVQIYVIFLIYRVSSLRFMWKFIFLNKSKEYSWKRMGRANLCADRRCIYPPVFSGKSDWIFCKSASFLQRKSCCNATVFPSYVGAPAVFLSYVSFYSEIFRPLLLGNILLARVFRTFSNSQIVTWTEVIERGVLIFAAKDK